MSKEYNYALFKFVVNDRDYFFVPASELPTSGFSSLYYITKEESERLEKEGFKAYKGTVWSPWLWIDEDTEQGAIQTEERLRSLNLKTSVFTTGNRGKHFRIERKVAPSPYLPALDKEWVETYVSKTADLTVYTPLHLFRNVGTRHEKTGEKKEVLYSFGTSELDFSGFTLPVKASLAVVTKTPVLESLFLNQTVLNLTVPASNGTRNESLVKLAVSLRRAGESPDFIGRWLYHTNLLYPEPVKLEEIQKIVEWVALI